MIRFLFFYYFLLIRGLWKISLYKIRAHMPLFSSSGVLFGLCFNLTHLKAERTELNLGFERASHVWLATCGIMVKICEIFFLTYIYNISRQDSKEGGFMSSFGDITRGRLAFAQRCRSSFFCCGTEEAFWTCSCGQPSCRPSAAAFLHLSRPAFTLWS